MKPKIMTKKQLNEYAKLLTAKEKAQYLLKFEIVGKVNIVNLDVVCQAFIGTMALPITGEDEEDVVAKATKWLEEKAA